LRYIESQTNSLRYVLMSNQDPARLIAERVARRLSAGSSAQASDSKTSNGAARASEPPRARVVDFISPAPPAPVRSSIGSPREAAAPQTVSLFQVAQSPWLAPFARSEQNLTSGLQTAVHPSEERFGVEEAAVSELVEFFENEKQCTVDPSGKPCDHCAMCSSRGF
jgi:hypothetical protein